MKKSRLTITPLEYEFISIYHCSPEIMFERLCQMMDSKSASERMSLLMETAWKRMQTIDREKHELYAQGFKLVHEEGIPFDST